MAEDKKSLSQTGADKSAAPAPQKKHKYLSEISTMDGSQLFDFAVTKVLIPAAKKAIIDILQMYFSKGGSSVPISTSERTASVVQTIEKSSISSPSSSYGRSVFAYEGITWNRYSDAEHVLETLKKTLQDYQKVKVADLYELAGWTVEQIDYIYGWKNLDGADVGLVSDSNTTRYKLILPKAVSLK
mgnify:CR=1 FL=1